VQDGHLESVSLSLKKIASLHEVREVLRNFSVDAEIASLPTSVRNPVVVTEEDNRPQPRRDLHAGNGMAAVVGRVRQCPLLDVKLTLLSHNLVRGAAGAALLNAELLAARGFFKNRVNAADQREAEPVTR
jgi:aspartate-semialdehyde dehydrogenase